MTRLRCALAALVVVGALGGCSDDDPEPKVDDPTPSVSSGPTESVSVSPTVSPALTPKEAVKAWVDAQNEALSTGSTDALRALAAPDCQGCDDFPEPIEEVFAAGGSYEGGEWKLIHSNVESSSPSAASLTAAVTIASGTTIPEAGAEPVTYEAQNHLMSFELVPEGGGWRFSAIAFVS